MNTQTYVFAISRYFEATKLLTIPDDTFNELPKIFRAKDPNLKYFVVRQFDNCLGNSYNLNSYKIFDAQFSLITELNGIYRLANTEFKEKWEGKWSNTFLILELESGKSDKYEVKIETSLGALKTIQQIAIVLEAFNERDAKLSPLESKTIREKLDGFIKTKKI